MKQAPYIEMKNVSKRFRRNMTSLKSTVGYILGTSSQNDFWAVKDISLQLSAGESLGILGRNGAGKSTLLKILAHITKPTYGTVTIRGRIGALIEVGAGFHPELTGRENIFLYGAILGMSRSEIRRKFNAIVSFAEIENALETPVKFYSSGMYMRLGFAVTIHMDPDILLIDEALAVGDSAFQEKCFAEIDRFKARGKIVIFVSHNLNLMERYTSRCLVLDEGTEVMRGDPTTCVRWYHSHILQRDINDHTVTLHPTATKKHTITKINIGNSKESSVRLQPKSDLRITIDIQHQEPIKEILCGVAILREGTYLFGSKSHVLVTKNSTTVTLHIPKHPFLRGTYTVSAGIWQKSTDETPFDLQECILSFVVESSDDTVCYDGHILVPHSFGTHVY